MKYKSNLERVIANVLKRYTVDFQYEPTRLSYQPKTKIGKGSKTTYADWCDRYKFEYSDSNIPKKWFK